MLESAQSTALQAQIVRCMPCPISGQWSPTGKVKMTKWGLCEYCRASRDVACLRCTNKVRTMYGCWPVVPEWVEIIEIKDFMQ